MFRKFKHSINPMPTATACNHFKACTPYLLVLLLMSWTNQSLGITLKEGDIAPNWMLSNGSNKATMLYDTTNQGQRCVLIFWTTRCKTCKTFLPKINQLAKEIDLSSTVFYALNIWEGKDPSRYFLEQAPDLNLLLNADAVASRYGITSTPSIVVVEANRRISYLNLSPNKTLAIQDLQDHLTPSKHARTEDLTKNPR